MPRETVHYGRDYAAVTVRETKTHGREHGEYVYETGTEEAKKAIATGDLRAENVRFDTKPHLDVLWSRPIDRMSLPVGEDPRGSVQVQVAMSPQSMQARIDHIADHPEDLEHYAAVFTEPLTRPQINHLIRTLKRARDAAYGTDE